MIQAKSELAQALAAAVAQVAPDVAYTPAFESPKQAAHGDLAITAAMPLAKSLRLPPRAVAEQLVAALNAQPAIQRWVSALEIAGPGFINLRLAPAAKQAVVTEVLAGADRFGIQPANGDKVIVEFVSANPTGPLHLGHASQAALGSTVCNLLASQGWAVQREFYYNDAGVQIATLANSTQLRIKGFKPGDPCWPTDPDNPESKKFYNGDYVADIAADFLAKKTVKADDREFTASGNPDDLDSIRQFAVAYLRHEQDLDLQAFGVHFDNYFLETSLYSSDSVNQTVAKLVHSGKTYELDNALWLRTTDYGDDKDRVMRKSDGTYTYFVPDVAYHLNKWERGFKKAINVQGSDHHGTIARVRAGLQCAAEGVPQGWPDYLLHKMITVMRGGQEVKISKRAGSYVTLRDLIDWTSRDAVRFFLVSRKADTEFTFDIDMALKQSDENPVFYVQYAHARICSVLRQYVDKGGDLAKVAGADLSLLTAPAEATLMLKLAEFPQTLASAARDLAPHDIAYYARSVAANFHTYYAAERFLVDDPALALARLALLTASAHVLRNALAVLGVSAPEVMNRDEPAAPSPIPAAS
ncbi:MAG: arginine--tRNA ligase [Burkholderiaceae bacterium]|jgi:arginyl-tRNA synthetase